MTAYADFLAAKKQNADMAGFEPTFLPDCLMDFQRSATDWSVRKGRAALYEGCGLGKSLQTLVFGENVVRHTNGRFLIATPLAVAQQFVAEGEKFGIECRLCRDGKIGGAGIYVTNYERLHYFNPSDFAGMGADEAGILKNFDAKTKDAVVEFMRPLPYRLLATATPAPNDYVELGNSAEALGELGFQDMVTRYFKKGTKGGHTGWARETYQLRPHAVRDFWRWVCSWARALRKPSDLGFDDGPFVLPPLVEREHEVRASRPAAGRLFDVPAENLREECEERRRTVPERCRKVAELVNGTGRPAIVWCHLNPEADLCEKLIPGSVQVSGSQSDDEKEELLTAFAAGQARVLVSKSKIAGYGLNLQHCAHMTFFVGHSWEQYYQSIRRCWRFGQQNQVTVDVVTTEGGQRVLANLQRKAVQAEAMFEQLVSLMNEALGVGRPKYGDKKVKVPAWL